MDSKKFIKNLDEATLMFERLFEVWLATNSPPKPNPGRPLRAVPARVTLIEFLLINARHTSVNYGRKGTLVEIARRSIRTQAPKSLDKHARSLNRWAADFTGILLEQKVCPRTKIPILVSALPRSPTQKFRAPIRTRVLVRLRRQFSLSFRLCMGARVTSRWWRGICVVEVG